MSNTDDGWSTVTLPEENKELDIEIEIEEEPVPVPEAEAAGIEEAPVITAEEGEPKELEGIETSGAQKRIKQLVRQRKDREEHIEDLLRQNEELKNNIQVKDKEVNNIAARSIDSSEKQLTQNIALAREAYMEAFEEGNKEKVLESQEILNSAQADLKTVQRYKVNINNKIQQENKTEPETQTNQPSQAFDPKAQDWASKNSWFGEDTAKTAAALALDAELKGEGYDPNDDEFYEEIDQRLEKSFGQTSNRVQETEEQNNSGTSQPAQVVSGASRSSPNSGKKVKLSKEDVRLATKWGIPLEQYAAEKLKVTQADGEYTNVNM